LELAAGKKKEKKEVFSKCGNDPPVKRVGVGQLQRGTPGNPLHTGGGEFETQ